MYQVSKSIIIIKIESDIIASPLSLDETIIWYRNKLGYEMDEPLDVEQIDITKNAIINGKSTTYEDYCIEYLNSDKELKEPIILGGVDKC